MSSIALVKGPCFIIESVLIVIFVVAFVQHLSNHSANIDNYLDISRQKSTFFMTEKEKIKKYLEYQGISKNKFYQATGFSVGFLDSGNSLGVDKVKTIINKYPDLSLRWLVLDEGDMIVKDPPVQRPEDESWMKEVIRNQAAAINRMTARLEELEKGMQGKPAPEGAHSAFSGLNP
jgi:hypothetical protein